MNTKLIYHGYKVKRKNDIKVKKEGKISNQFNQIPHLTQKTFLESENTHRNSKLLQSQACLYIRSVFAEIFIAVYQTQTIYADWNNRAASYLIVKVCIDASVRLRTNNLIGLFF